MKYLTLFFFLLPASLFSQSLPALPFPYHHYDFTDTNNLEITSSRVTKAYDISGNGLHLDQGNGVLWNPAGYATLTPGNLLYKPVSIDQPYSWYIVCQVDTWGGYGILNFGGIDENQNGFRFWYGGMLSMINGSSSAPQSGNGSFYAPAIGKTDLYAGIQKFGTSSPFILSNSAATKNGLPHHEGNSGDFGISKIQLGEAQLTHVKELIIIPEILDPATDKQLRNYLLAKFNITDTTKYVMGFGDSNTYGTDTYLTRSAAAANLHCYNKATPASMVADLPPQFANAIQYGIAPFDGYVTIMLGANGSWNAGYKSEMIGYINDIIDSGFSRSKIILITPPDQQNATSKLQSFQIDNMAIADSLNIKHCDLFTATINQGGYVNCTYDGTHLNEFGTGIAVSLLTPLLKDSSISATSYYSKPAGDITQLATWGSNADGTGSAPPSFDHPGFTFTLTNRSGIITLNATWNVKGKLRIDHGIILQLPDGLIIQSGNTGN